MGEPRMIIHLDFWPLEECVLKEEEFFYGMCRKCNKCGRFDEKEEANGESPQ